MRSLKQEKAQVSIEVLILIAGAIVLATLVGVMLLRAAQQIAEDAPTA